MEADHICVLYNINWQYVRISHHISYTAQIRYYMDVLRNMTWYFVTGSGVSFHETELFGYLEMNKAQRDFICRRLLRPSSNRGPCRGSRSDVCKGVNKFTILPRCRCRSGIFIRDHPVRRSSYCCGYETSLSANYTLERFVYLLLT